MNLNTEEKARSRRDKAKEAIALALESRWEEALALNRQIVEDFPKDVEALNRLGKALSELGQYKQAEDAFRRTLEISRANTIARKNLKRLAHLGDSAPQPKLGSKVAPQLFIEERGRTATMSLRNLPPGTAHLPMAPGDAVDLKPHSSRMTVENVKGEYLGEIEPKLGLRLAKLVEGGNRYTAAVTAVDEHSLVIMIKETYRHPSQYGTMSFPARQPGGGAYSYPGTPPVPIEMDLEEEEDQDRPPIIDWDEEGEANIAALPSDDEEVVSFVKDNIEEEEEEEGF